jgi:hypothetical protein
MYFYNKGGVKWLQAISLQKIFFTRYTTKTKSLKYILKYTLSHQVCDLKKSPKILLSVLAGTVCCKWPTAHLQMPNNGCFREFYTGWKH